MRIFFVRKFYAWLIVAMILPIFLKSKSPEHPMLIVEQLEEQQPDSLGLSLCTSPTWHDFSFKNSDDQFSHNRWAWTWSLTLKSKEALKLHQLTLQWIGQQVESLYASLYQKKDCEPMLIPIQENLVSEGMWDHKNQQLIFSMNERIIATNKYYLVLSFPQTIESLIKHGTFMIPAKDSLIISKLS